MMKIFILCGSLIVSSCNAASDSYFNKLADAIYWAEGGEKSKKPYGLIKYNLKSKQAYRTQCIIHIKDYYKNWNGKGDFVNYLASKWSPTVGVSKWEAAMNKNWIKNVSYFMRHPKPVI